MKTEIDWGIVAGLEGPCFYGTHPAARFLIKRTGTKFILKVRVTLKVHWTETVKELGLYDSEDLAKEAAQEYTDAR